MNQSEQNSDDPQALDLKGQIELFDANAQHLASQGLHEDAEKIYREILRLAPNNLKALHYLATRHISNGELEQAQRLIEHAIRIDFGNATWHQNLGIILRSRGYLEGALRAFEETLKINPSLGIAWVQRGDVFHALGRHEESITCYCSAEIILGNLENAAAKAPPKIALTLKNAAHILHRTRIRFIEDALSPVRQQYDRKVLRRAEEAISVVTTGKEVRSDDPLQKPTGFLFPGLAAKPFFERSEFAFLDEIEKSAGDILDEARKLPGEVDLSMNYKSSDAGAGMPRWQPLTDNLAFSGLYLYRRSFKQREATFHCPQTMTAVEALPLAQLNGLAPDVYLSKLNQHSRTSARYGVSNFKLKVLLPLLAPRGCAIKVGDVTRQLHQGECLIFDESFEHERWNRSQETCLALEFEIWHAGVTQAEREFLSAAQGGIENFNIRFRNPQSGV